VSGQKDKIKAIEEIRQQDNDLDLSSSQDFFQVILMTSPIISPSPFFLGLYNSFRGDFKSQSGQSAGYWPGDFYLLISHKIESSSLVF